jgi:hypothetical protein
MRKWPSQNDYVSHLSLVNFMFGFSIESDSTENGIDSLLSAEESAIAAFSI